MPISIEETVSSTGFLMFCSSVAEPLTLPVHAVSFRSSRLKSHRIFPGSWTGGHSPPDRVTSPFVRNPIWVWIPHRGPIYWYTVRYGISPIFYFSVVKFNSVHLQLIGHSYYPRPYRSLALASSNVGRGNISYISPIPSNLTDQIETLPSKYISSYELLPCFITE